MIGALGSINQSLTLVVQDVEPPSKRLRVEAKPTTGDTRYDFNARSAEMLAALQKSLGKDPED